MIGEAVEGTTTFSLPVARTKLPDRERSNHEARAETYTADEVPLEYVNVRET